MNPFNNSDTNSDVLSSLLNIKRHFEGLQGLSDEQAQRIRSASSLLSEHLLSGNLFICQGVEEATTLNAFVDAILSILSHLSTRIETFRLDFGNFLHSHSSEQTKLLCELDQVCQDAIALGDKQHLVHSMDGLRKQLVDRDRIIAELVQHVDVLEAKERHLPEQLQTASEKHRHEVSVLQAAHFHEATCLRDRISVLDMQLRSRESTLARLGKVLKQCANETRHFKRALSRSNSALDASLLEHEQVISQVLPQVLARSLLHTNELCTLAGGLDALSGDCDLAWAHQRIALSAAQGRMDSLQMQVEQVKRTFALHYRTLQDRSRDLTRQNSLLSQKSSDLQGECERSTAALNQLTSRLQDVEGSLRERDALIARLEKAAQAQKASFEGKIRQAISAAESKIRASAVDFEALLGQVQENHKQDLERMQREQKQIVDAIKAQHAADVERIQAGQSDFIDRLKKQQKEEIDRGKQRHETPRNHMATAPKKETVERSGGVGEDASSMAKKRRFLIAEPSTNQNSTLPLTKKSPIQNPFIVLSGFRGSDQSELQKLVQGLGGSVVEGIEFPPQATHVLRPANYLSLRSIYGLFSGRWLVTDAWLRESVSAGFFVEEEHFGQTAVIENAPMKLGPQQQLCVRTLKHTPRYARQDATYAQMRQVLCSVGSSFDPVDEDDPDRDGIVLRAEDETFPNAVSIRELFTHLIPSIINNNNSHKDNKH